MKTRVRGAQIRGSAAAAPPAASPCPARAQHSSSSMTSMTMVRGPVRIRLLTVR